MSGGRWIVFSVTSFRIAGLLLVTALFSPLFAQVDRGAPLPRKGALGVQLAPMTPEELKSASIDKGVKVNGILPGLTGERLKMQAGDVILSINGVAVGAPAEVSRAMSSQFGGSRIALDILRSGKREKLEGLVAERPRQKEDGFKVIYDQVLSQGKRIRVIITHPEGKGPFPALYLIGGIGAYSVDGDFASVAYGNVIGPIAKSGFATIRIDKPGQGDSEGPAYTDLLFDDELDAYRQALKLAKSLPVINPDKIAVFGHSMGGCFGPLLAQEGGLAGVSVYGTLAKTWVEYMLENSRRQSLLAGAKPGSVDADMRGQAAMAHLIYNEGLSPAEAKQKHPQWAEAIQASYPDGKTYSGVGIKFFQQLAGKNLMGAWEKTDAMVLAIYAENDFLCSQEDHEFIAAAVNALRPGTAEFKLLEKTDHGFSETTSQRDSQERWTRPGKKFNPTIITVLTDWLKKVLA